MSLLQDRLKAANEINNQRSNISNVANNISNNGSYNQLQSIPQNNQNKVMASSHNEFNTIDDEDDDILSIINSQQGGSSKKVQPTPPPSTPNNTVKSEEDLIFNIRSGIKKNVNTNVYLSEETLEGDMSEEMLEAYELKKAREEKAKLKRDSTIGKIVNSLFVVACLYIIFLIYGVVVTDYYYDESGNIVPQVLSVSDIKESKGFEKIMVQYESCRILYEKILMLDYRLSQGIEDPLVLALEYEELLSDVENILIQLDALKDTKYSQIKGMLYTWAGTDAAIYLQKISSAISLNNSEDASIALSYQTIMYNDFSLISENMVSMGESLNGIDVTDIKNWSPEGYLDETIKGNN